MKVHQVSRMKLFWGENVVARFDPLNWPTSSNLASPELGTIPREGRRLSGGVFFLRHLWVNREPREFWTLDSLYKNFPFFPKNPPSQATCPLFPLFSQSLQIITDHPFFMFAWNWNRRPPKTKIGGLSPLPSLFPTFQWLITSPPANDFVKKSHGRITPIFPILADPSSPFSGHRCYRALALHLWSWWPTSQLPSPSILATSEWPMIRKIQWKG